MPVRRDLLSFIEAKTFQTAWRRCDLDDEDLLFLQLMIMVDPKSAPVIEGTGGLRKLRFSPAGAARGKSGSHRVCYVYFEEFGIVLLVTVYEKKQRDNLSAAAKKTIRQLIERQHAFLSSKREP